MSPWWSSSSKSVLHVTASSSYNDPQPQTVPINTEIPIIIDAETAELELIIRIKDFLGSTHHKNSPNTSPYFTKRKHANISIQISVTPKQDISGNLLLFGNDFGYPIHEFLPYGTSTGLKLFKKYVDPSVDGDLLIEEPYLYGKALSSFNVINSRNEGEGGDGSKWDGISNYFEEDLSNIQLEEESSKIPDVACSRQRFFHDSNNLKSFVFQKGQKYHFDFFSGLISLQNSEFHINLPGGYSLNLSNYLNEKFNKVRYVLKRDDGTDLGVESGEALLVINFELVHDENEDKDEDKDRGTEFNKS